mgnify:CR=1 FL=1
MGGELSGSAHRMRRYARKTAVFLQSRVNSNGRREGRSGYRLGANDFRLNDHTKNELGMEGENYIRYAVCLEDGDARLEIYRVGYAPEDTAEKPFAVTKLVNWKEKHRKS